LRPRSLKLRAPRSQDEWDRLHAIRKQFIFDLYHPPDGPWPCEYDPAHPDDRDPANRPLLLFVDGEAAGTLRLDLKPDERAVVRLVALAPGFRGGGLGAAMLGFAEALARASGARRLCVNAQPGVVGFYARRGFAPGRWEGCSSCPRGVPMAKALAAGLSGAPGVRGAMASARASARPGRPPGGGGGLLVAEDARRASPGTA
jgi:GNAT superfamily N-acetyltransferase